MNLNFGDRKYEGIPSRTLLLDPLSLSKLKEAANDKNNTNLQFALNQLISQADVLLAKKPVSVVDKDELPPSGDIHDFLSLAPYRWPDPNKTDGLPYIGRDGFINPEIYSIPDQQNLNNMIYAVTVLSAAYYLTDDAKYAYKADQLLSVWFLDESTKMNPHLKYAETVRGKSNVYSGSIMAGVNLTDIVMAVGLIQDSPAWTKEHQSGLESWFTKYLGWLMNSRLGKQESQKINNHGTYYYVQVATIASFLNKTGLAKNTIEAFVQRPSVSAFIAPEKSLAVKIQSDGRQPFELQRLNSLQYSMFNLQGLYKLADIGQQLGIDLWNYKSSQAPLLKKALDFLMPYILEKRPWPYLQVSPISGHISAPDLFCHAALHYPQGEKNYTEAYKYFVSDRPFFDVHNLPCLNLSEKM